MLRHPIFDAVMAHEVGHTLGLRHNFSGSYDALNYHPRYWSLREDGRVAPRAWDPMTEAEIDGRIREYQYASVMDYGHNFVVTDAEGIGHYDVAAIKMGYGDLVEVFENAPDPATVAWIGAILRLGWPVALRLESFTGGEPSAHPYTEWPQILGGRENIERRRDVPYTSLRPEPFLASEGIDEPSVDAEGRPVVPYLFCSDEQADLGPDCLRYDAGADPYETLQSIIDAYFNYYIFNAYRRGRLGFDVGEYADRILTRYLSKLQYANQIYALFRPILEDIFGSDTDFFTRPDGMGAYTLGVGAGYQLLRQIVATPEPGTYVRRTRADGTAALVPGGGFFGDVTVDSFDGRPLDTTWDFDAGYYWFDQLERVGYYYDKALALWVLTDPETHFLGRDTAADVRQYQINYYTTFAPSLTGFFGALLADDWACLGARALPDGSLRYPDARQTEACTAPGVPIDPNASFSIQLHGAVYGLTLISETFDNRFREDARIFVRGAAEGVSVAPGTPVVEFTDPRTGLTYVALSRVESGRERGAGARMLEHARALAARGAGAELDRFVDNIEVVRRIGWLVTHGD
ncbi:MAG: zinc-dependent metalloprotease [Myxococcales bacterium]|nr:zinc-dependent metalloprotease [Myxococcales bacterium]